MEQIWKINDFAMWYSKFGYRVWTALEIEFGIWPVVFGHKAGIVWTIDEWQTVGKSSAFWQHNVLNHFGGWDEIWKSVINVGTVPAPVRFSYALYVETAQGLIYWDNNKGMNYSHNV